MLRRSLIGGATLIGVLIVIALMWAIRPWAAHEPGRWYLSWPPHTRAYNFSHWHKVVPYQTVSASSNPRVYERDLVDLSPLTFIGADGPMTIGDYLESEGISGMMVLQAGDIRFEHYDRGIDAESRYHIWSATKSFTSTLIGIALHQGVIDDIDDPIRKYAAQFDGTVYGDTSIRHVLMMSSGVNLIHDPGHKPSRRELYNAIIFGGENLDDFAARLEYRVDPGTDFNYAATDTHVLGAVLRAAYGQKLGQIATEQLWQPATFKWATAINSGYPKTTNRSSSRAVRLVNIFGLTENADSSSHSSRSNPEMVSPTARLCVQSVMPLPVQTNLSARWAF